MRDERQPCVYILASHRNGTLYTGVTSDLIARLWQHRTGETRGFTSTYGVHRLMWFGPHDEMESAIVREKRIKKWNRAWKITLIEAGNPHWRDLSVELGFSVAPSNRVVSASTFAEATHPRRPYAGGDPPGRSHIGETFGDGFPPARE